MASGGYHPAKQAKSEQKRRSNWQRSVSSERDDAQSLNSLPSDIRINNWDLADLRPLNLGDSKRRKKSKGNTEREREQSLSMDSPPRGEGKHRTPSSFPRTKITPSTPTSQRMALENLKQHMTFSDLEDQLDGAGSERNNERHVSQTRSRFHNTSVNHADSEADANHINRNNNMDYGGSEQGPDSNEIVARLMQIRDFMKQARSMLNTMEKMGDRKKSEDVDKVRRLILNLQEQEQGYKGLLQNTLKTEREVDGASMEGPDDTAMKIGVKEELDDSSVDLEVRTQNSETSEGSQENLTRPRIEDKLGLRSEDEDVEYSNTAQPAAEDGLVNGASPNVVDSRDKRIEIVGVQETEEGAAGGVATDRGVPTVEHAELVRLLQEKQQQLQALMHRQEELNLKRRETEKKLLEAQARDNKARAALSVVSTGRQVLAERIKADAVREGAAGRWQREGGGDATAIEEESDDIGEDGVLKSNIVGYPESDDDDNSNVREIDALPTELLELKRQLNFLRNEFSQIREAPKNTETEAKAAADDGCQQLQNKLQELQTKKYRMDKLLQELQMLHMQPLAQNNAQNSPSSKPPANIPPRPAPPRNTLPNMPTPSSLPPSLQARMSEVALAAPDVVDGAMATFADLAARGQEGDAEAIEPATLEEVQEKLRRLKEVRTQLDQLRGLVTYYQEQKDRLENGGDEDDTLIESADGANLVSVSNPAMPQNVRKSPELLQQQRQQRQQQHQDIQQNRPPESSSGASARAPSSLLDLVHLLNLGGNDADEQSDEDNVSVSQSDSQWSNLGPWDDDPEIQEKVKKLKAAKEKLRQLQDLVAFVQQSPDAGRALPPSLGDLAASVEGEAVSQATQTDEPNISMSEGEVPPEEQRQQAEEVAMENTRAELEQLRRERASLLDLQSQLKHLHAVVGRNSGEPEGSSETEGRGGQMSNRVKGEPEHAPNATVVTFASNDELYSKMRRQRILREELRSKKKELEAIMKKDRNKRQYSRNQDNQSDTVSLNTDTFGIPASVDATMATWGGSTVDNLENITEDEDGQNDDDEDEEDDGYPSDGIVQVEEEEEENDTDNGTYTIEADARQRKNMRKSAPMGIGARPKTSRGKQTFPQPSYSDQTMKKTSQKQTRRSRGRQRESKIRQGNYRSAEDLIQEDENNFKGKSNDWVRLMESRLNNLSSSVESLMRKLDSNAGRQLSVSLNQENTTAGATNLMSPMQEQMLQLHNQSMMLSFSNVVQSLARQQGDLQQMQQQMQNLQIQMQDVQHDHGYQNLNSTAPAHNLRPSLSASMLNNSSYNLHATAPSRLNAQNMSTSFTPYVADASPGFLSTFGQSPALPLLHGTNPIPPPGNLGGQSVSTGSNLSLHQQATGVPSHMTFNPSNSAAVSHGSTSVSTMTRDFSQFVNTLQPTVPLTHIDNLGQSSNVFEPTQTEDREAVEESREIRMNTYKMDRKRKPARMKKSEASSSTCLHVSTPKVENHKAEDRGRRGPIGRENSSEFTNIASVLAGTNTGLSADIDHTDFDNALRGDSRFDANSSFSSIQSIRNELSRLREMQGHPRSANPVDDGNTLFDSLRDTIYAEVASLISQNENRPHFLLELFREMRQVDSDFLRQRTLYSLQDVLNTTLKSTASPVNQPPAWLKATQNTLDTANSDQTPSESMTSEDDEDAHVALLQEQISASKRDTGSRGQIQAYNFDYEETADNPSSLSTPSNFEESPFFQDALGETVIELDSLKRNERKQANKPKWGEGAFLASEQLLRDMKEQIGEGKVARSAGKGTQSGRDVRSTEGMAAVNVDQASESSMSDIPYPRIDMKQLDRQIKQVMMETIPIIKEHMDDICSPQFLAYIKRLILSLTSQSGSQEFDRFFQRQLSSILQDTLEKYEGRKICDCGEDLLVEISDILFNELAFFRLMQDLDDPNIVSRMTSIPQSAPNKEKEEGEASEDGANSRSSIDADDGDDEELPGWVSEEKNAPKAFRISEAEQEEMGRERDDEMANETNIRDAEEKDDDYEDDDDFDDGEEHSYKIELAPSETKPFTRIGSDEDDDNSDEEQSIEDPSETAVSRNNALMGTAGQQSVNIVPPQLRPETEGAWGDEEKEKQDAEKSVAPKRIVGKNLEDKGDSNIDLQPPQVNGTLNGGPAHSCEEDEEGGAITVDDLPQRLTVGSSDATASPPVSANTS